MINAIVVELFISEHNEKTAQQTSRRDLGPEQSVTSSKNIAESLDERVRKAAEVAFFAT